MGAPMRILRESWNEWKELVTVTVALLGAIAGATWYLASKIGELQHTTQQVEVIQADLGNLRQTVADLGALKSSEMPRTRGEISNHESEIKTMQHHLDELDSTSINQLGFARDHLSRHDSEIEALRVELQRLSERVSGLDALKDLVRNLLAKDFKIGTIQQPSGETRIYTKDELKPFLEDLEKTLRNGKEMHSEGHTAVFIPGGKHDCTGPPTNCFQVSMTTPESNRLYRIDAHLFAEGQHLSSLQDDQDYAREMRSFLTNATGTCSYRIADLAKLPRLIRASNS